jgi:hypothetical protein
MKTNSVVWWWLIALGALMVYCALFAPRVGR